MAYEKQPPLGQAAMAASLPVVIASDQSAVPVSATSLPLPSGAGTSANQTTIIGHLDGVEGLLTTIDADTSNISTKIDTLAGAVAGTEVQVDVLTMPSVTVTATNLDIRDLTFAADKVDASGSVLGAGTNNIGDVDVLSSALPTGAATLAEQQTQTASLSVLDDWDETDRAKVNIIAGQAGITAGAGAVAANTPRITHASDDPVTVALQIMDDWDNGASDGASVSGDVAHDSADAGEPVKIGGKGLSADPTAVATADRVNALFDLLGKQVVLPYAIPESAVSGAITTAMTGTTSTSLVAAPGSGLRNYITTIIVSNAHATVGTDVIIQDGSGGTTLLTIPAAAVYGGAVITLPTPLRQPTTNTAIYCANVTTGASTKVSAVGFKAV